jgi:hypothetical protein
LEYADSSSGSVEMNTDDSRNSERIQGGPCQTAGLGQKERLARMNRIPTATAELVEAKKNAISADVCVGHLILEIYHCML